MYNNSVSFSDLVGKKIASIEGGLNSDKLVFTCTDGSEYEMYHNQDCCESVSIEDIDSNLQDFVGETILGAEETSNSAGDCDDGSCTWTFYKLYSLNHSATIRWYGSSNGYYSTGVSFYRTREPQKIAVVEATDTKALDAVITSAKREVENRMRDIGLVDGKIVSLQNEIEELNALRARLEREVEDGRKVLAKLEAK
jgi:hypothetical protein